MEDFISKDYEEQQIVKKEVVYRRPTLFRRMMAELVDLITLVVVFLGVLLIARSVVNATPYHDEHFNRVNKIRIDSCLYVEDDRKQVVDIVTYINKSDLVTYKAKKDEIFVYLNGNTERDILGFFNFCLDETVGGSIELQETVLKSFYEYVLDSKNSFQNVPMFIEQPDGSAIENVECKAQQETYYKVYSRFVDDKCQGYLASSFSVYKKSVRQLSLMIFAIEFPVSYAIAGILVYFVPTLIFRKGHKTLGKLAYRIGVVGNDCLNISWKKNLARFAIFYFAIFLLSIFTFAIPLIVSFSLKAFSKKKQSFSDYMLGLNEIDTTGMKIYNSLEEAAVDQIPNYKAPVDFKRVERE